MGEIKYFPESLNKFFLKRSIQMQNNRIYIDSDLELLIPQYLKNRENEVEKIKKLLKENDFEKIRYIGHSLKGSGGGYGFDYLTELGAELEKNAELKKSNDIKKVIKNLEDYLNNLEIIYQKE